METNSLGEENYNTHTLIQKIDELLNVLLDISSNLREILKSLKDSAQISTPTDEIVLSYKRKINTSDIRNTFSKEFQGMLFFEEDEKFVTVKPKKYLGTENFARIASIIRDQGGEYVSEGKNSHFKIPKYP